MDNLPLKRFIWAALWVQGITALAAGVVCLFFGSFIGAISATAGGAAVFLAQCVLAWRVLSNPTDDPVKFVGRFYSSEFLKLLVSGVLFAVVLWVGAIALYGFIGFGVTILSYWVVPIFVKKEVPGHVD